jgi:hypothetical protein
MSRRKPVLPEWRLTLVERHLEEIASLNFLVCLTPEPEDSDELLHWKAQARKAITVNVVQRVDMIRSALDPEAKRDPFGYPYIPYEKGSR